MASATGYLESLATEEHQAKTLILFPFGRGGLNGRAV
jgi:hypothetical protein